MTLDLCQNFVFAQYLENKLTDFHQILYMHSYWKDLAWDFNPSFSAHLYHSYGPWFMPKFRFHSISQEQTDFHEILYMHSHWQDLAWDWCMSFFAHLYQSYGPWFTPKFDFRSLSWEQIARISLNFIYAFIDKIYVGIVTQC